MVAVAQSVELQIVVLAVAGSNPVGHPISNLSDLLNASLSFALESEGGSLIKRLHSLLIR